MLQTGWYLAWDTLACWGEWLIVQPLPCLCFHTWCWKASEMPSVWVCDIIPTRVTCCKRLFTAMLFWTVQSKEFPHQTVLLLLFLGLASCSQQSGWAASPNPSSGHPRCISRHWDCFEIFEQNISEPGVKKKKEVGQDHMLLWGKRRTLVVSSAGKMPCGKSMWISLSSWNPAVPLENSTFVSEAPFCTKRRLYFLWCCCAALCHDLCSKCLFASISWY